MYVCLKVEKTVALKSKIKNWSGMKFDSEVSIEIKLLGNLV